MANALELIKKEKKERTGRLDLGNCGLSELPDELFELTWLEELID
jgi:internalin A